MSLKLKSLAGTVIENTRPAPVMRSVAPPPSTRVNPRIQGTAKAAPTPRLALPVQRDATDLVLSGLATPFGCCNFFDRCSDELMSLHYGGRLGLLDWMNFEVSVDCHKVFEYITFVRPAMNDTTPTGGYLGNPCAEPSGLTYGSTKLEIDDFGLYGRTGPTRSILRPERYCVNDPRKRLDGQPITSEYEWDIRFAVDTLLQDIRRHLITGNATTPGQFDGLQRWVKSGYASSMLDSIVVNWNQQGINGGAGVSINGTLIGLNGSTYWGLIDVLIESVRRIRERISWSPMLDSQQWQVGDMILVVPGALARCILNAYTCWSVCPGEQYKESNLNTYEARQFRNNLNGGMFGEH